MLVPMVAIADMEIRFINVGQGDAAIVTCDGETMIIDGGPGSEASMVFTIVKNTVDRVKYLVSTHPHEDHVGGLASVLNAVPVDAIMSPVLEWNTQVFKNMVKYAEQQGTPIFVPDEGNEYTLGNAVITILHCWPEAITTNDMSIVLRIDYGQTSVLFTGDAEITSEYMMLDSGLPLKADVLKVGHHGSNSSSSLEFLNAVSPKYAVISCGYGNSFGHPNRGPLFSLKLLGVTLFRTDMQGTITMHSDGKTISFSTERTTKRDLFSAPNAEDEPEEETNPGTRSTPGDTEFTDATFELEAEEVTYVLNKKTKKFHYPTCSSVKDIKPENRQDFYGTRDDAIALGYKPCGNCNP
uniref:Metallo-beta-lactamase domain protein n=1 Tax=uncultured bacterium Contig1777 TaxID=1393514 RepID=W0FVB9_9BACT|nr:metallo-beta-lactamase domain protein [uncultured bacterium Contig1777]